MAAILETMTRFVRHLTSSGYVADLKASILDVLSTLEVPLS